MVKFEFKWEGALAGRLRGTMNYIAFSEPSHHSYVTTIMVSFYVFIKSQAFYFQTYYLGVRPMPHEMI